MGHSFLSEIIMLLAFSVVTVALFRRLHLPPILAYLLVGIAIGPYGFGLIQSTDSTHFIAEFGVVFLLFTIGLEFSLAKLVAMRRTVFGLGLAQVLLSTLLFASIAWLMGQSLLSSAIIGGILALSSTAIVVKQLAEQLELNSRHGRTSIGILLFQDLAVIPLLVIIPVLAGQSDDSITMALGWALLKAIGIFLLLLAIGHWLLRPLFAEVARARSAELFTLTVLLISLAAAWATDAAGLSLALGGFLAGMMLGETEYRHQVETDIRPFQDVLLGFFFITIGMLVDLPMIAEIWYWVIALTLLFVLLKGVLITLLSRLSGSEGGVALRCGVTLAQGGEFGFALIALALGTQIVEHQAGQVLLLVILCSMVLAPFLIRYNGYLAKHLYRVSYNRHRHQLIEEIKHDARHLSDHVVICGYGRVGQSLAHILEQQSLQFVALDLDPVRVQEAVRAGEQIHYGDATHHRILEATGIERAKLLVISIDDVSSVMKILTSCKKRYPNLPILTRAKDDSNLEELQRAGATEVVPETVETSLMLGAQMLTLLKLPVSQILKVIKEARSDRYKLLRAYFHGEEATSIEDASEPTRSQLHTVQLPEQAFAVGRSINELSLTELDVQINAIRRAGIKGKDPCGQMILKAGDVVVLWGPTKNLYRAEEKLLKG